MRACEGTRVPECAGYGKAREETFTTESEKYPKWKRVLALGGGRAAPPSRELSTYGEKKMLAAVAAQIERERERK